MELASHSFLKIYSKHGTPQTPTDPKTGISLYGPYRAPNVRSHRPTLDSFQRKSEA